MQIDKDINIWRFNLHTHNPSEQSETFEYCKKEKIIGTGWGPYGEEQQERMMSTENEKIDDIEFEKRLKINQERFKYDNFNGFRKAMKALRAMKIDDLIWTRKNNEYYLCRVTGEAKDFMRGERSLEIENSFYDIWHYIPCDYVKIGTEENILGTIVRSFNMGVVCHIRGKGNEEIIKNFSKKTYNDFTKRDYYRYTEPHDKWKYFLDSIGALEVEEIVGLYMQMKLGYGIYTSTNKRDTKEYEYILFSREKPNQKVKLQVKTTDINLNEYNYGDKLFYFFTLGNYYKDGKILHKKELEIFQNKNKAVIIKINDLIDFAKENENNGLLPYKMNWFK